MGNGFLRIEMLRASEVRLFGTQDMNVFLPLSFLRTSCSRRTYGASSALHHLSRPPIKEGVSRTRIALGPEVRRWLSTKHEVAQAHSQSDSVSARPPTTWVDKLPARARPYLYLTRIDKPIGTLLLFYPCGVLLPITATVNQTDHGFVRLLI